MKLGTLATTAAIVLTAGSVCAQESRPLAYEVGVVQGIILRPYLSVGIVAAPWSIRLSGAAFPDCSGLQLNIGRVVRDSGNAKHTLGIMFADFRNAYCYPRPGSHQIDGQYFGVVYDFQVKGFFVEVGPGVGARNPVGSGLGAFSRVYGQLGYVHRFGKKYTDDDD
jgi:hypothetical protein